MPSKQIALFIFLIINIASAATIQERIRAEDILRYFPEGTYSEISHYEQTDHTKTAAWEELSDYITKIFPRNRDKSSRGVLPSYLRGYDYSCTFAMQYIPRTIRQTVDAGKGLEAERKAIDTVADKHIKNGGSTRSFYIDRDAPVEKGKITVVIDYHEESPMFVYRFRELGNLIKEVLANGALMKTGEILMKLPVYKSKGFARFQNVEKDYFLYATPFNELLVSENKKILKQMVIAGEGLQENLLADRNYVDLLDIAKEIPPDWRISFNIWDRTKMIERMESNNVSDSSIKKSREWNEQRYLYIVRYVEIDEEIREYEIRVYKEDEHAAAAMKRLPWNPRGSQNSPSAKYRAVLENDTKRTLEGNRIVSVLTHDKKHIAALDKYYADRKAEFQKRKKEQEAAKKQEQQK